MEIPPKVTPADDDGYLEELTKAIFRAGFNWRIVREKWPNFRRHFDYFCVDKIAAYTLKDFNRLLINKGIVRNRRKIIATVCNAKKIQSIKAEHKSFKRYLRSLDSLTYYEKVGLLTKNFSGLGRTGAYVFLYCTNEKTPSWDER